MCACMCFLMHGGGMDLQASSLMRVLHPVSLGAHVHHVTTNYAELSCHDDIALIGRAGYWY